MPERKQGTVKWFNNSKGYGFIESEGDKDHFVHMNEILMDGFKTLSENQKVEFEVGEGPKGKENKEPLSGSIILRATALLRVKETKIILFI